MVAGRVDGRDCGRDCGLDCTLLDGEDELGREVWLDRGVERWTEELLEREGEVVRGAGRLGAERVTVERDFEPPRGL